MYSFNSTSRMQSRVLIIRSVFLLWQSGWCLGRRPVFFLHSEYCVLNQTVVSLDMGMKTIVTHHLNEIKILDGCKKFKKTVFEPFLILAFSCYHLLPNPTNPPGHLATASLIFMMENTRIHRFAMSSQRRRTLFING